MKHFLLYVALTAACAVNAFSAAPAGARDRRSAIKNGDPVILELEQGSEISGTYRGRKGGQIWLEIPGGEIFIEPTTVTKIRRISANKADYLARKASVGENDAAAHWSLSQFARSKDLRAEAIEEAKIVLAIMPHHHAAAIFLKSPSWILQPGDSNQRISPQAPPVKRSRKEKTWRVSGTVYSLVTLKPEPGALITFRRNPDESETVTSNQGGGYEIEIPKGEGWTVSMEAPHFRRGQLLDLEPSYRFRDEEERRAVIRHTREEDLAPAPVGWNAADSRVRLDLIAVPSGWMTIH